MQAVSPNDVKATHAVTSSQAIKAAACNDRAVNGHDGLFVDCTFACLENFVAAVTDRLVKKLTVKNGHVQAKRVRLIGRQLFFSDGILEAILLWRERCENIPISNESRFCVFVNIASGQHDVRKQPQRLRSEQTIVHLIGAAACTPSVSVALC